MSGVILGIDPGLHGAVACLSLDRGLVEVVPMPTVKVRVGKTDKTRIACQALALYIAEQKPSHAFVEAVHAMPGQGVTSMFTFGQAFGQIEGVLAALGVPVTYVTPAAWKREMQVGRDKGSSRMRAMQLWPAHAASFVRVKDDGVAEAALIGLHGLRSMVRSA